MSTANNALQDIIGDPSQYIYNPMLICQKAVNYVEALTLEQLNGDVINIPDPTTPFTLMLDFTALLASTLGSEGIKSLSKVYPSMSQSEKDLYRHMSDVDFIDRFAQPAPTSFTMLIQLNSLYNELIQTTDDITTKVTIPRNTKFKALGYVFSISYPIDIEYNKNTRRIKIQYDYSLLSPLYTINSQIIEYTLVTDKEGSTWIKFDVPVLQFDVNSSMGVISSSFMFDEDYVFTDNFYYCRVYQRNNGTNKKWSEIHTTFTDQVLDPYLATACLKLQDNSLNVSIPPIYVDNNLIEAEIRVDIYTTKGVVKIDLSNVGLEDFSVELTDLDNGNVDDSKFIAGMENVTFYAYSANIVNGGRNMLTFQQLRDKVINNSLGVFNTPITEGQLATTLERNGFTIIKNIDLITNRVYLAMKDLPPPSSSKLVLPANLGIETYVTTIETLEASSQTYKNTNLVVIPSNSLFINNNGIFTLLSKEEKNIHLTKSNLDKMLLVNTNSYFYIPFFYVFDYTSSSLDVRAYHLDNPSISNQSFISHNDTVDLIVNTETYFIEKIDGGFKLTLSVSSDSLYKSLTDSDVGCQIYTVDIFGNDRYLVGELSNTLTAEGERVFIFYFNTNYNINKDNNIVITNMVNNENTLINTTLSLTNTFKIIYTTKSIPIGFTASSIDADLLVIPNVSNIGITQEYLEVIFGYALEDLWIQHRSAVGIVDYQRYDVNIPDVYTEPVYRVFQETDSIFNASMQTELLHEVGEIKLDLNNDPIYLHKVGDLMFDGNGNPIPIVNPQSSKHVEMLFIEGLYLFATDNNYVSYTKEVANIIANEITSSLVAIDQKLLEKTRIFYYPKKNIGTVLCNLGSGVSKNIKSEQLLHIILHVPSDIFRNEKIKLNMEESTIRTVHNYLKRQNINTTDIINILKPLYGNNVINIDISGLGGSINLSTLYIVNQNQNLSLQKRLVLDDKNELIIEEFIDIEFKEYKI